MPHKDSRIFHRRFDRIRPVGSIERGGDPKRIGEFSRTKKTCVCRADCLSLAKRAPRSQGGLIGDGSLFLSDADAVSQIKSSGVKDTPREGLARERYALRASP